MQSFWLKTSSTSTRHTAVRSFFECKLVESYFGFIKFKVSGNNAFDKFRNECGGHRWQRIPPTEHQGRYHTSTITVAVLEEATAETNINWSDVKFKTCRGTGNGGQNRNKRDTAVWLMHEPSGIQIRSERERSQYQNKLSARNKLSEILKNQTSTTVHEKTNTDRKTQVGSGQRGDKIRTIRVRDNIVTNHVSGKKISYTQYCKGNFKGLY